MPGSGPSARSGARPGESGKLGESGRTGKSSGRPGQSGESGQSGKSAGKSDNDAVGGLFKRGLWQSDNLDENDGFILPAIDSTALFREIKARGKTRVSSGARSRRRDACREQLARGGRGRFVRAVAANGIYCDIAWDATLRGVAPRQKERRASRDAALSDGALFFEILPEEILRKRRLLHRGRLLLLAADISGSMGGQTLALAKKLAFAILNNAYLKRDKMAMIAFRERSAERLFEPSCHPAKIKKALETLPCGGTTPLAAALRLSGVTARNALRKGSVREAVLVLISDGRANVGSRPGYEALLQEVEAEAAILARIDSLSIVFLDATPAGKTDFAARDLERLLGARRLPLNRILDSGADPVDAVLQLLGKSAAPVLKARAALL